MSDECLFGGSLRYAKPDNLCGELEAISTKRRAIAAMLSACEGLTNSAFGIRHDEVSSVEALLNRWERLLVAKRAKVLGMVEERMTATSTEGERLAAQAAEALKEVTQREGR